LHRTAKLSTGRWSLLKYSRIFLQFRYSVRNSRFLTMTLSFELEPDLEDLALKREASLPMMVSVPEETLSVSALSALAGLRLSSFESML